MLLHMIPYFKTCCQEFLAVSPTYVNTIVVVVLSATLNALPLDDILEGEGLLLNNNSYGKNFIPGIISIAPETNFEE